MLSLQRLLIPSSKRLLIPSSKRLLRCPPLSLHGFCKGCSTRSDAVDMAFSSFQSDDTQKRESETPLIIMHGLMGSKRNWRAIAKGISEETGRQVFAVDSRNHGDSPHTEGLSYPLLANDILKFMSKHGIPKATLMGHCMGGRAAMLTALQEPSAVDKLLVVEVSPYAMSPRVSSVPATAAMVKDIEIPEDLNIAEARNFLNNLLLSQIPEEGLRQYVISNITHTKAGYRWITNIDAIITNFNPHIVTFPFPSETNHFEGKTAFITGSMSDYIRPDEKMLIRGIFPQATFYEIEGAGHSPQFDKPRELMDILIPFLKD